MKIERVCFSVSQHSNVMCERGNIIACGRTASLKQIVILFLLSLLSQPASSYWCQFPQVLLLNFQFRDTRILLTPKVKPDIGQCQRNKDLCNLTHSFHLHWAFIWEWTGHFCMHSWSHATLKLTALNQLSKKYWDMGKFFDVEKILPSVKIADIQNTQID